MAERARIAGVFEVPQSDLDEVIGRSVERAVERVLPKYLGARRPPLSAEATPLPNTYVTRAEAAQLMRYSLRTITRLIDAGKLRACGPRRDRIATFEIDRFMAEEPRRPDDDPDDPASEASRLLLND